MFLLLETGMHELEMIQDGVLDVWENMEWREPGMEMEIECWNFV